MTRRRAMLAAAVCAVALVGAACSGSDDSDGTTGSSTTRSSTTTTTFGASTIPDTTPATVGIICTTPEDAVQGIVAAWGANDRAAASRCATIPVIDRLFQVSGVGNSWLFQGCDRSDPGVPVCAFSYEGGAAFFTMEGTEAAGWKATKLEFLAD
ncbi:MAG: hypothetical protein MUP97_14235 [Acidimicrobiia bacterium]|nr:hypothetical protein [Acidimicrobiia bacterium]